MVPLGVLLVILGTILRGILYIHKLPINRKAADTCNKSFVGWTALENSTTGTRTRVARVRAEYPNQLDYSGCADLL